MPNTSNYDQVTLALTERTFVELLGLVETIDVEFKSEPYRLNQTDQVFEFVKDVCSMLNAEGGLIVVGVRTDRFQAVSSEMATGYVPFKRAKVRVPELFQILSQHTFPAIGADEVSIEFLPDTRFTVGEIGLLSITVIRKTARKVPTLMRTSTAWGVPSLIYPRRTAACETEYPVDELVVDVTTAI